MSWSQIRSDLRQWKNNRPRQLALSAQLLQKVPMKPAQIDIDILQSALLGLEDIGPSSDFDLNVEMRPKGMTYRPAAVLVPLIERAGKTFLILTKRSAALKHHPGQISFPGGKVDAQDTGPMAAALREAHEEIGLKAENVEIVGVLPNHETVTGFDVYPYVGCVNSAFRAVPEMGEVEEVFEVPLAHVLSLQNYLVEGRVWMGKMRRYYVVPYGPHYIWGATARMLRMLADRMEAFRAD